MDQSALRKLRSCMKKRWSSAIVSNGLVVNIKWSDPIFRRNMPYTIASVEEPQQSCRPFDYRFNIVDQRFGHQ